MVKDASHDLATADTTAAIVSSPSQSTTAPALVYGLKPRLTLLPNPQPVATSAVNLPRLRRWWLIAGGCDRV